MHYATAKPDSPALTFLLGFISSDPEATFPEAQEAAAREGHRIAPVTWSRARRMIERLYELDEEAPMTSAAVGPEPAGDRRREGNGEPGELDGAAPDVRAEHSAPVAEESAEVPPGDDADAAAEDPAGEAADEEPAPVRERSTFPRRLRQGRAAAAAESRKPAWSVRLPVAGHQDVQDWLAVVDRMNAGAPFVLEYSDGTWRLRER